MTKQWHIYKKITRDKTVAYLQKITRDKTVEYLQKKLA